MTALDGPAFFRLAHRMAAYRGVMRERVAAAREDGGHTAAAPAARDATPEPPQRPGGRNMVPASRAALENEPGFAGIFSFGTAGGDPGGR